MKNSISGIVSLLLIYQLIFINPTTANPEFVNIGTTWELTTGSPDVTIAVIDSGILWTGELSPSTRWENEKEISGQPQVDDDGNGYIDDFYGLDLVDFDNDPSDDRGDPVTNQHGTWIANIIASSHNNSQVSLAPDITIQNSRIFNDLGFGSLVAMGEAIQYAIDTDIDIISLSLLTDVVIPDSVQNILQTAVDNGIIIVAPRYNFGTGMFSGEKSKGMIAVQESESGVIVAESPNYSIYTPSTQIKTFTHLGQPDTVTGISFAVPLVAGTLSLMKSINPDIPFEYLPQTLIYSASDLDQTTATIEPFLNVYQAVSNSKDFFDLDFDSDGLSNGDEIDGDSDPFDPNSTPSFLYFDSAMFTSSLLFITTMIITIRRKIVPSRTQ